MSSHHCNIDNTSSRSIDAVTDFFSTDSSTRRSHKAASSAKPQTPPRERSRRRHRRSKKRPTKKVTFCVTAEYCEIPSVSEYTSEEKAMIWSSRAEERANRRDCMDIVALMDCDMLEEDDSICTRGLEPYTEDFGEMFQEHMNDVYEGVAQIQAEHDNLLEEPFQLTLKLADWLLESSIVAHEVAHEVALNDANEAYFIHSEEEERRQRC